MGASAEEMKVFLAKRGYDAEVELVGFKTYKISIHSKAVDDIANLLAHISDGSRFVVTVYHPDVVELVANELRLKESLGELKSDYESKLIGLQKELTESQGELSMGLLSVRSELAGLTAIAETLTELIKSNEDRIDTEEKKPWWKKPWKKGK